MIEFFAAAFDERRGGAVALVDVGVPPPVFPLLPLPLEGAVLHLDRHGDDGLVGEWLEVEGAAVPLLLGGGRGGFVAGERGQAGRGGPCE